jgi:hypothetical protein
MTPGMQLLGVNSEAFSVANLRQAIVAAENSKAPIKLLLKRDKEFITLTIDYHSGLRYPNWRELSRHPTV